MSMLERIKEPARALFQSVFPAKKRSALSQRHTAETLLNHASPIRRNGHVALMPYRTEPVRNFIHALKYERHEKSIKIAAEILYKTIVERAGPEQEKAERVVCVVPETGTRKKKDGYSCLHAVLDEMLAVPGDGRVRDGRDTLRWSRSVARQSGLKNKTERARNMRDAMRARCGTGAEKTEWIVIDDVITTGATLSEARRALKADGAETIRTIALAY